MYRILPLLAVIIAVIKLLSATPLDDYVNKPDPTYSWQLVSTNSTAKSTVYGLNLTSQTWMDSSFSSQSVWRHYMVVTIPKVLQRPNYAFLHIGNGRNSDKPPSLIPSRVAEISGSIAVELLQIPDQPISFPADPSHESRTEDEIIAWTWRVFLESNGSNPNVLLQLPMTKAVVRAMDATQEFVRQQQVQIPEKFILSGESKRGWATWLAAAVDTERVAAAIPVVMDLIHLNKSMMSHYQSLAGWTFALYPYYMERITGYLGTPQFEALAAIADVYPYLDRYRNTKIFQVQAADDQFFLPDNENFFWDDLQTATGGSYLKRIPNIGHLIYGYEASLESFYLSVCDNSTLPSWNWTRTTNATHGQTVAIVSTDNDRPKPVGVKVYQARTVNGTKRDFRLNILDPKTESIITNPIKWLSMTNIDTTIVGQSIVYTYTTPLPPEGHWDGLFMQVTFLGPNGTTIDLTTETLILPNTYAVAPCAGGAACVGTLV